MKSFIALAALSLISVSSFALECRSLDAQYIGKVKEYRVVEKSESTKECFYKIEFSMFNSSYICPLDIDEVYSFEFQDQSCSLKNGDQVSGIVSNLDGKIVLE